MPTESEMKAAALRHSQTRNKHVIVFSYADNSWVRGVYGPYDTPEEAEGALVKLTSQPIAHSVFRGEIFPLVNVLFL